jgi:hypothetical protein
MPPALIDTQRPDMEIADLWPAFLATHPALQVPSPLTREAYNTLAPTLGPWLMATQGLPAVFAQLALASIWSVLAGLHGPAVSYRFHALSAVLQTPCPRWAAPFDLAVAYDGVLFAYPEILSALAIDSDRAEILAELADVREAMARVARWIVTDAAGVPHVAVSLTAIVDHLSPPASGSGSGSALSMPPRSHGMGTTTRRGGMPRRWARSSMPWNAVRAPASC